MSFISYLCSTLSGSFLIPGPIGVCEAFFPEALSTIGSALYIGMSTTITVMDFGEKIYSFLCYVHRISDHVRKLNSNLKSDQRSLMFTMVAIREKRAGLWTQCLRRQITETHPGPKIYCKRDTGGSKSPNYCYYYYYCYP